MGFTAIFKALIRMVIHMRTWKDFENEVLGLMFSNNIGGFKITEDDASVAEYIINMPDAANCVFRELASICPCRNSVVVTTNSDKKDFDMLKICKDFMAFDNDSVYFLNNGMPEKADNYFMRGGSKIAFTGDCYGNYEIYYIAYPTLITHNTEGTAELELSDNLLDAAAYGVTSRLYAEDDISLATYYMNIYENKKTALAALNTTSPGGMGSKFVSERGWY